MNYTDKDRVDILQNINSQFDERIKNITSELETREKDSRSKREKESSEFFKNGEPIPSKELELEITTKQKTKIWIESQIALLKENT